MGADVSRVRFDPLRDFAGVVLQQGRLLLDGDFNEYVALLDRRLRAETCDLTSFGPDPDHAGVAWVPRQTPDGFRVTASGGELTIGRGRMYVDGLLAENHGLPQNDPTGYDALLDERTGTADTPYDQQPYWPTPDPLPSGGPHLAYLDVWEREVTYLEDPDLVEVAVGVDTTARWQTAWQVRLLPNIGTATCESKDSDIPGWLDVIQPSAGRLTTATIDVPPTDDPCKLPPVGGYRGLENQTYRVEVHDGGAPGTATFKWSRDNGSVAISVVEMVSTTVLRLASVGKDDVLRVSTGDWVEILDDHYELGQKPGVLRKVTVDDAERTITFTGAIPADLQPADADDAAKRHLRVRRWDQAGVVKDGAGGTIVDLDSPGAAGAITVPSSSATQVVLESGVVVSFSVASGGSGRFHAGDYWIFAARTGDTSIETLDAAPPLGVHHHFARLGTVTFPGSQSDCRRRWPPEAGAGESCACTVCVTPESHASGALTIQAAVDQVKAAGGGTVCLEAGRYVLREAVNADGARSLRIHGQGPGTLVLATGTALTATQTLALAVDSLAILSGAAAAAAVQLRSAALADLHDLVVLSYATGEGAGAGIELSGPMLASSLRRNVVVAHTAITAGGDEKQLGVLAAALRVQENVLVGLEGGLDLGGRAAYMYSCRLERNEVLAGTSGGIVATGAVLSGGTLDVSGNKVATSGAGITVGPDAAVDSNVVNALALRGAGTTGSLAGVGTAAAFGTDGIVIDAGDFTVQAGHVRITGNRVHDRSGTGISLRTAVQTLIVKENIVSRAGAGILIESDGSAERASVDNNEVLDVVATREGANSAVGIGLMHAGSVTVAGNTVARVGIDLENAILRAGIFVLTSQDVRVTGNVVDGVGPPGGYLGLGVGVAVFGPFEAASVSDNSSRFSADQPAPSEGVWIALLVESVAQALGVGNEVTALPAHDGVLVLAGASAYLAAAAPEHVGLASNSLSGGGNDPTCLVRIAGELVAEGNQCEHVGGESPVAMDLTASAITVSTNRARGTRARIVLHVDGKRFAALGNLAPGGTHLGSSPLPAPWAPLNPTVP